MSSERQIALSTGSRYATYVVTGVVMFVLTPFLVNAIGPVSYALQALSSQAVQFVGIAATAIGISYDRFAAQHYARREFDAMNALLSAGLKLSLVSAGLLVAGTLLSACFAQTLFNLPDVMVRDARLVLTITGLAAAFHIVNGVWKSPLFITQRFYLESFGQVAAVIGSAVGIVLLFAWTRPSIVTWVLLACGLRVILEWCCVIPLCRRALPEMRVSLRTRVTRAQFMTLLNFSGLSLLVYVGSLLYYATDSIIIANLDELGIGQVTYYSMAQRWDPQIRMVITAFAGVLTPLMTADAAVGNLDRLRSTVLRGSRYALILALYPALVLGVFAAPFFHFYLGPEFAATSTPVLRVIMATLVITVPGTIAYEAIKGLGQLRWPAIATLAGGLLNLALSIFLVRVAGLGLVGVALASAAAFAFVYVVAFPLILRRTAALPLGTLFAKGVLRALIGALPLLAAALAIHRIWPAGSLSGVLLQFAACGACYAPAVWFISLDPADRSKLRAVLARLPGLRRTQRS